VVSKLSNAALNSSPQSPSCHNNEVHLIPTTKPTKYLHTVNWLKVSATIQTYSNIYENHLEGITFAFTKWLPWHFNLLAFCNIQTSQDVTIGVIIFFLFFFLKIFASN